MKYYFNMSPSRGAPRAGWEGLTDPETGELRSSTPSDMLGVPTHVEIEGDVLCFDWFESGRVQFEGDAVGVDELATLRFLKPPPTLLEHFLRLRSDDEILVFARRFGPLAPRGLYMHDLEASAGRSEHRELLDAWRQLQSEFNGLLRLVAAVREKKSPPKETFAEFHALGILPAVDQWTLSEAGRPPRILAEWESCSQSNRLATARSVFTKKLNAYTRYCALRPALTLKSSGTGLRFDIVFQDARADFLGRGLSLFGALTVQLMSAATGSALAICSACGHFFVPGRRRPAFGKRRYCRACGRTAAVKDAVTDYRTRARIKNAGRRRKK